MAEEKKAAEAKKQADAKKSAEAKKQADAKQQAAAKTSTTAAKSSTSRATIHAGSFRDEANAKRTLQTLRQSGVNATTDSDGMVRM